MRGGGEQKNKGLQRQQVPYGGGLFYCAGIVGSHATLPKESAVIIFFIEF